MTSGKKTLKNDAQTARQRKNDFDLTLTRYCRTKSESVFLGEMIFEMFLVIIRQLTEWTTEPLVLGLAWSSW